MIFNSYIFIFLFLPLTLFGFWFLRSKNSRYLWITAASFIFYGYWNYKFIYLLLLSTAISFFSAKIIIKSNSQKKKKLFLILSIICNLILLGFFKYFNFGVSAFQNIFDLFRWNVSLSTLNLIIPVGISFYTFQSISYAIDVYRGNVPAINNFLKFSAYTSFFPKLTAGPIARVKDMNSDLENINRICEPTLIRTGISIFVIGLFKKVIIADSIANLVNPLWADYASLGFASAWIAVLGYTYQLYFDFSGYSDMAIGLGRMLGFNLPQNFNSPYKAVNISDFWQRWHITLSSWLRDYLYIPLGGSRRGVSQTYINLFITMLLGGLWHGANWTFVIWGAYNGALLAAYRAYRIYYDKLPLLFQRFNTFLLVAVGWTFFRSPNFSVAANLLKKMFNFKMIIEPVKIDYLNISLLLLFCILATNFLPNTFEWRYSTKPRFAAALAMMAVLALIFMNYKQNVFLYYQF